MRILLYLPAHWELLARNAYRQSLPIIPCRIIPMTNVDSIGVLVRGGRSVGAPFFPHTAVRLAATVFAAQSVAVPAGAADTHSRAGAARRDVQTGLNRGRVVDGVASLSLETHMELSTGNALMSIIRCTRLGLPSRDTSASYVAWTLVTSPWGRDGRLHRDRGHHRPGYTASMAARNAASLSYGERPLRTLALIHPWVSSVSSAIFHNDFFLGFAISTILHESWILHNYA